MFRSILKPLLLGASLLASGLALAEEPVPQFGRYLPLYPGLYFNGGYAQDERDWTFDQNGYEQPSAAPQAGGQTGFPEKAGFATFAWHFPMFESEGLPFFSSRTHTARVTLRYADTRTEGRLADFVADASDDPTTEADDLKNEGHGVGDLTLELGSFLAGTSGWRKGERHPFAVLLLGSLNVPTGTYDRDAPISAGSNTWYFQARLGMNWQPWAGAFLESGIAHRDYTNNEEPAFGALMPHKQGDDFMFDISLAQRFTRDLYAMAFWSHRQGQPSEYRNPVFAPNAPPANNGDPANTDVFPTPGVYRDAGTELQANGLALQYFVTQRWLAALHYVHPQDGRSGQFLLPFSQKTPRGCVPGAPTCTESAGDTVLVDGMGPARTYSTDRLMLSVTYNFGQGDAFTCAGCER